MREGSVALASHLSQGGAEWYRLSWRGPDDWVEGQVEGLRLPVMEE